MISESLKSKIFLGGACPQTPLAAGFARYEETLAKFFCATPLVNPPNSGLVRPLFEWPPHFKIASDTTVLCIYPTNLFYVHVYKICACEYGTLLTLVMNVKEELQ